jgi:hypothetical protein
VLETRFFLGLRFVLVDHAMFDGMLPTLLCQLVSLLLVSNRMMLILFCAIDEFGLVVGRLSRLEIMG